MLAISNIAWTADEEEQAAAIMAELGVTNVEVAPTKTWEKPLEATEADAKKLVSWWAERGITIVAMQSLLFNTEGLNVFDSPESRAKTLEYLKGIMRLADWLGAGPLVFGSPKNRQVGDRDPAEVQDIAHEFFNACGDAAREHGVTFCIEPNAPQYACDFVSTAREGLDLVKAVAHPNFRLHLDVACMTLAGDDFGIISEAAPFLAHSHLSSPYLDPVPSDEVDYTGFAGALADAGFAGYRSIEMKPGENNLANTRAALEFAKGLNV